MVRDTGKYPPHSPDALFSATQAPTPRSRLFWATLITQRPLLLLGSLWLVMICISSLAAHRLLFADPGKDTQAPRVQSQALAPEASGQSASPSEAGGEANGDAPTRQSLKVTLLGLSSLVGVCALGSFVISQQAKAAARQRPKRRMRRVKPKAKAKAPTGPKRLQPYSPDRDAVIVKGAQAVRDTLPLSLVEAEVEPELDLFGDDLLDDRLFDENLVDDNSAATPQRHSLNNAVSASPVQPLAAQPPTVPIEDDATSHSAEVLPQDEAHPLDWTEDSLAHALDLRQRRSLSSLM